MMHKILAPNRTITLALILFIASAMGLLASQTPDADVASVEAIDYGDQGWTFIVTVHHPDTGWDDYCDGWDVVSDQGVVIKNNSADRFTRPLLHSHEHEQPFIRSQSGLRIPAGAKTLTVRAHDIVHGFGGKEVVIDLGINKGPGYKIIRK